MPVQKKSGRNAVQSSNSGADKNRSGFRCAFARVMILIAAAMVLCGAFTDQAAAQFCTFACTTPPTPPAASTGMRATFELRMLYPK